MPIEQVPGGRIVVRNARDAKEQGGEEENYYEKATKDARAQRQFLEEKRLTDEILNPPGAPEPQFQIRGGVDLGTIDVQADRRASETRADAERDRQQKKVDELEKEKTAITDQLHKTEIANQTALLTAQMDDLRKQIAAGAAPASLESEIAKITTLAGVLGLSKPDPGLSNPQITLELKKMDIQLQREANEYARQAKIDDRNYNLEVKKLEQMQQENINKLDVERAKLNTLISMPERAGAVLARAIIDGTRDKRTTTVAAEPEKKAAPTGYVEAKIGEAGEVECPGCGAPVGIGPTARIAQCVACSTKISIHRKNGKAAPAAVAGEGDEE